MIDKLSLAIEVTKQFRHSDIIVSENVLREAISLMGETGNGFAQLNLRQDHPKYRYMHRVYWGGMVFIHYSCDELSGASRAVAPFG